MKRVVEGLKIYERFPNEIIMTPRGLYQLGGETIIHNLVDLKEMA
ncbi:hypothetical protein HNQ80_003537 [Anaerosolibacter carboniphilus]|uniref:Uncharacterized protein n=1 Tax=Anaerosolibacter carboniphilus TaxID=1417629 RepID=A0A841KYM3_9FIRM|nr:hypothetical protein [Anaerosolibacter carboniphilus]MBB6217418.1 hypothetical protein [Anaerosolibacter carboniphilus]